MKLVSLHVEYNPWAESYSGEFALMDADGRRSTIVLLDSDIKTIMETAKYDVSAAASRVTFAYHDPFLPYPKKEEVIEPAPAHAVPEFTLPAASVHQHPDDLPF